MAHFWVLAAILALTLTLRASLSASQREGFQSINCGGDAYNDSITTLIWEEDPFTNKNELLYGNVGKVNASFRNITTIMTTLRYFPNNIRNKKFCYSLPSLNGSTYLLRASFLYGNYDGLNQPPAFVLILNYDKWIDVTTSSSPTPIMKEITFVSMGHILSVCFARQLNSNHTPFISTLEIRLLENTMYNTGALLRDFGLMLWKRINYGAITNAVTRYPDDPFDRIWEANTTGPVANISTSKLGNLSYVADLDEPPAEVMATAITSKDSKANLSFTYDGFGGLGGFRIDMHFQELVENASDRSRVLRFAFPNSAVVIPADKMYVPLRNPAYISIDQQLELPAPLQITLFPVAGSPRGPLLNAIELFTWTPQALSTIVTFQGDVDAIEIIQKHFDLTGVGQGDPCMPKGYGWTWIVCNNDTTPKITEIHLANFNLTRDIPQSINNITNLEILDLSNNMLNGQIPDVSHLLRSLKYLDLHNNSLTGVVPPSLAFLPNLETLDLTNTDLCGSLPSFQISVNVSYIEKKCNSSSSSNSSMISTSENKNGNTRKYIYAISFLGALYIVSMVILLVMYKSRHSKMTIENSTSSVATNKKGGDNIQGLPFITKMFTYNEIRDATLNFTTILGEGGFGKVYHGLLPTGEAVAVKMLADASKQGLKEFYNEVAILSRVRHKNLVSLIGYCVENTYILIYEYIAKGNLKDMIYGNVEPIDKPLQWLTRINIALDASQGLDYLHTGCDPTIIHRDVKSSNILLSDKMQAKVSDFGLSRFKEGDTTISHVSTANVVGTAGYLDPAYNSTNQLTDKSDVYSFGIVLFELICGRAPINMFSSPPHIVEWVTPAILKGKLGEIVDPVLANGYKMESMWKVIDLAFGCVESDRMKRPKMIQVSQTLRNALEIEMDPDLAPHSQDVSGSSSTSTDGKLPTFQYIDNLRLKLEPR